MTMKSICLQKKKRVILFKLDLQTVAKLLEKQLKNENISNLNEDDEIQAKPN